MTFKLPPKGTLGLLVPWKAFWLPIALSDM